MTKFKTHCIRNHEMIARNLYYSKSGIRTCRACLGIRMKKHRELTGSRFKQWDKTMFGGNREKVILRDGEHCIKCKMTRIEHKNKYNKDLTVDHIDKKGLNMPRELKNNAMDNLQTLCIPCHGAKDASRKLTVSQVINIRHMSDTIPMYRISRLYGVGNSTVVNIIKRNKWKTI